MWLPTGLKYQDITVKIKSKDEGHISFTESPHAKCENMAPDITKKKPA